MLYYYVIINVNIYITVHAVGIKKKKKIKHVYTINRNGYKKKAASEMLVLEICM